MVHNFLDYNYNEVLSIVEIQVIIQIRECDLLHRNWKRWQSTCDGFTYNYDVHVKMSKQYTQSFYVHLINLLNKAMQFYTRNI